MSSAQEARAGMGLTGAMTVGMASKAGTKATAAR